IYTDVSGDNSSSRYYRMTYEATWEFHTSFHSSLIYDHSDTSFLMRSPQKYVDTCWRTTVPTNILIGTTTGLSENFLSKAPLQFIPLHSEALSVLYSILVKVYSTSKPEYQFWNLLMKNTENTGSLFDPQPSTITGNIQCLSNPAEPVIGYVGVGIPAEKRIWINNSELPISWNGNGNFYECSSFQIVNDKDSIAKYFEEPVQLFAAVKAVKDLQGDTLGYEITRRRCADCTQRGTTQRPPFWP
ncbi:MAG: DUF4249 family protein, partial [Chitinophagaceae bacterium]